MPGRGRGATQRARRSRHWSIGEGAGGGGVAAGSGGGSIVSGTAVAVSSTVQATGGPAATGLLSSLGLRTRTGLLVPEVVPAGYTTAAVNFDGATGITNASLTATDGADFSYSLWLKGAGAGGYQQLFVVDPETKYINWASIESSGFGLGFLAMFSNQTGNGGSAPNVDLLTDARSWAEWTHILVSAFTNGVNADKKAKVYINGTDVTPAIETGAAFTMLFNGLSFWIGDDSFADYWTGDLADVWIAPNQTLLTDGDISAETLAKFRDPTTGKPVNLGADGSTPTGVAPAIFLRRAPDAAASTFLTNLGTGGDFTEASGALTAAGTSPSD